MTHTVHFLVVYNKLSRTCCISSQQAKSAIPHAGADAEMHPDRGGGGAGDGGPVPWHSRIYVVINHKVVSLHI